MDILDPLNLMLERSSLPLVFKALSFSLSLNFAIDIFVCPIMPFGGVSDYLLVNPFLDESLLMSNGLDYLLHVERRGILS